MKHSEQDPLTDHIRSVLYNHHEPYVLGSWERFNKNKLKKENEYQYLWLRRIAAMLLLTAAGFYVWLQPAPEFSTQQQSPVAELEQLPIPGVELPSVFDRRESYNDLFTANRLSIESVIDQKILTEPAPITHHDDIQSVRSNRIISATSLQDHQQWFQFALNKVFEGTGDAENETQIYNQSTGITGQDTITESHQQYNLHADDEIIQALSRSGKNPFELGLTYLPLMNFHESQALPGMAGGLSAGWNISDNLTVTSGLLIAQSNLTFDMGHGSLMRTFESSEQTLAMAGEISQIQVELLSLELPIGIRYSINNQLSFSAGISSVTYLRERYSYEFEQELHVHVFTDDPREPATTRVVRTTETLQQTEPSFKATDWAAFYTFSMGYRFDVAERNTFTLEPFLKIPNQQVASRDIRYTTGGVQLTLTF